MYEFLNKNNLLTPKQSGFRPGDSTINQLLSITNEIHKTFDKYPSKETRAIFLDISRAFDKVWHEGLIFKLNNIQSLNLMKSGQSPSSETKFNDTHDIKHDDAWSRPKKPIKHTFPLTWDKTTTSNRFENLCNSADDKIKDDHVADADTSDIKIRNVKLKRQVQFLQKRAAKSTPNKTAGDCDDKRLSDTYPAKSDKPTNRTNERNNSPRSNSHAQSNESKRNTVTIMGESMISYKDEKLHFNKRKTVKVRSYPGATSED